VYGHVDRHKFDDDNNEEELLYHVTFPNGFHQPEYLSESEMDWGVCVRTHLNCKIAKYFDIDGKQELYLGYVHDAVPADLNDPNVVLFEVVYDDGDREDMEEKDLLEAKSLYQENDKEEKKDATPPKRRKRKQAGSKTTGVKDIGEGEDESPPFKSRASSRASKCNGANDDNDNDSDDNASLSGLPSTSTKRNIKVKVKEEEVKKQPPRSSRGKRKAAVKSESEEDEPDVKPSRSKRKAAATVKNEEDVTDISDEGAAARHHEPVAFSRSGRRRKAVSYKENDLVVVVGDSDEEEEQPKKKKGIKKAAPAAKGSKRKDEDDFELVDSSSDEELEDESDDELEDESDDESVQAAPAKKKNATKPKAKPATAKGKTTTPSDSGKKSMAESFEPMDRPLYSNLSLAEIRKTKRFLDPCGQEATDDIIGRLVGQQVDKIQSLFKRAMENGNLLGGTGMPLKLGTACSGTDAPSLALTLVQEQLELRGLGDLFHHTHAFSCENEPFKQAYLARNFDSVLYPDICKLTDDEPRDVFGQVQPIPDFNLFVAGTSCKNFSMLRATQRLDIEDKGCSGETFLAAVEFLFEQKPPFAIFENVQNAPWDKMSEYITGKIKLSSCAEKKAITGVKKNDKQDLEFVHQNGKIIVDKVPMVFGVRCGVAVAGYHRPGETKLRHVAWPSKKKERCTLADLLVENKIKKKDDTLVFDMPIRYHTTKAKVDTKDFGLPQTRSRMYLFVWKSEDGDDLGDYWKAIVEHLKSPVRHSLEAFILQEDHDIIRVFREALRGPLGRATKRGAFLESNFWESTNANLPHNKIAREKLGLEDMARTLTEWGPHGKKQLPPHYWLEFVNCCNQRQIDLLDILHASAARDAETHDSSFASFVWNISQNASREKHRSACPGISGCVTPGGEFFLPHLGRPLLGCEKLLLQGIPYFRLALGTETEVQLGDLAGNAMSLTVVCATMLAAMTCKQLREEVKATKPSAPMPAAGRILQASSIDRKPLLTATGQDEFLQVNDNLEFIRELASLSEDAIRTSIWCTVSTFTFVCLCCYDPAEV
jgi:site-specific DNA-cytosine methylase